MKKTILQTQNLTIGYKSRNKESVVATDINLSVKESKIICLLGQNGIGKSTLLRTISRMQNKLKGEVYFENESIFEMDRNQLAKKIGLVLTERIPNSNLTVYELVALGRQPYTNWIGKLLKDDEIHIQKAIQASNLEALAHKRCDELSDGQLQRALICRALAQDTKLILLDEPTAHLDIQHKIETFQLLKRFARDLNRSVLISTHEIQLATQMADELWLMNKQGIITGSPEELIEKDQINELFDRNTIVFDKESRQFKMI